MDPQSTRASGGRKGGAASSPETLLESHGKRKKAEWPRGVLRPSKTKRHQVTQR